jgi:hypothetical protein
MEPQAAANMSIEAVSHAKRTSQREKYEFIAYSVGSAKADGYI